MADFTPFSALAGGSLIGLSAVLLMALNGRVAGISGILGGALTGTSEDRSWRLFFLAGLIAGPLLYSVATGARPAFVMDADWPLIIAGGLLVGFGTRIGSGCTSGHGVCGLSRLSARSLTAVLIFMGMGMLTVTLLRTLAGS